MKETQPHSDSKVTLEALLRLKRAERPAAEFWVQFESDMRRKQLAAIVEKRAWWQVWPLTLKRAAWLTVPVGATAAVLFSFMAVNRTEVAPQASSPSGRRHGYFSISRK